MRTGLAISSVVHASVLLWALLTFTTNPLESMPSDSLPVDIISPNVTNYSFDQFAGLADFGAMAVSGGDSSA